jgi:hypothetical protein
MARPTLEVAEIFRTHGPAWRQAQRGHLSLGQHKVMAAIERCRSAALGGHVLQCPACAHAEIAYNSCRNRHCPKCQGSAARRWLQNRQSDLLPVEYYHVVFTLPAPIQAIAYTNKAVVYRLLFQVAAETLQTIAADPRHLGARIGVTLVLHTWGSALTHHPHVHGIVPGGGLSADGQRWVACRPGFFLPVRVLSRRFRHRFLEAMAGAHAAGQLQFFGNDAHLAETTAFAGWLRALRATEWVVYAKRPFAGPAAVLAYLSRYTHRVAIANSRLVAMDEGQVTFRWKDYRAKGRTKTQDHDPRRRGVHAPLPAARAALGFSPHPPLRPARQCRTPGVPGPRARTAAGIGRRRASRDRQRRPNGSGAPRAERTDLRLSGLRGADAGPGHAGPGTAHPGTASRTGSRMNPHNKAAPHVRWLRHGPPLETDWVHRPPGRSGTPDRRRPTLPAAPIRGSRDHSDAFPMGFVARIPSTAIPLIPIALRATPTTGTRPAVSSLEACPTPAP